MSSALSGSDEGRRREDHRQADPQEGGQGKENYTQRDIGLYRPERSQRAGKRADWGEMRRQRSEEHEHLEKAASRLFLTLRGSWLSDFQLFAS